MKKLFALLLTLAMVLSLAACGGGKTEEKPADTSAPATETPAATGKVYYLNFKPEADQAWQELAKTYTAQTGVEVKVVTAASGEYNTCLLYTSDAADER